MSIIREGYCKACGSTTMQSFKTYKEATERKEPYLCSICMAVINTQIYSTDDETYDSFVPTIEELKISVEALSRLLEIYDMKTDKDMLEAFKIMSETKDE